MHYAMQVDFSWTRSAQDYVDLYRHILRLHKPTVKKPPAIAPASTNDRRAQ
jgi:hypothetical protein